MTYLEELNLIMHELPETVELDIKSRVYDWMLGSENKDENHPYIKQQLEYAKRVIKYRGV